MNPLKGLEGGDWYFINSDAATLGHSPHDLWMDTGMAFSGGAREPYGERLAALKPGDTLLLWANQLGVVAVGRVLEPWDGRAYREHRIVYRSPGEDDEYRVRTQWLLDLRAAPLGRKDFGYNPLKSLQRLGEEKKRAAMELLLSASEVVSLPANAATQAHVEGESRVHISTRYERSASARDACIAHYGVRCVVCDIDFEEVYGDLGRGFIHVHHLLPISAVGEAYTVDPIADLRPVCPNCHAMLHQQTPPLTIEALRAIIAERQAVRDDQSNATRRTEHDQ